MTLYSLDDVEQRAIGQGEHWLLFKKFIPLPLHEAIAAELQPYLAGNYIDSSQVGAEVLRKIQRESPHHFDACPPDDIGGLFGMTLWNLLAQHEAGWRFYPKKASALDDMTGTVYFRAQDGTGARATAANERRR